MRSIAAGLVALAIAGLVVACGASTGMATRPADSLAIGAAVEAPSAIAPDPIPPPAVTVIVIPAPVSSVGDAPDLPPADSEDTGALRVAKPRAHAAKPADPSAGSAGDTNVLLSMAPAPTRSAPEKPVKPGSAAFRAPIPSSIPGVNLAENVPYVERPGADPHATSMDIYVPAGARGLPVLMYVHGGGWSGGDHEPVGAKAAYFAKRGFIFASINYRLVPVARPAEQADDVAAAISWIKNEIAAYGGDAARLFVLGHSAGAHLTALVASDETHLRRVGLDLTAIRGVILLDSAAYDVEQLMKSPDGKEDTFRIPFGADSATWRPVSPCAHVGPAKGIPPHLLLLATAEGQRRPAAEALAAALRAAGVYAQIADATAFRNHNTITEDLGQPGDTPTAAVQAFLDMLLRGAPAGLGGTQVLQPTARP